MYYYLWNFFIYAFLGWCVEVIFAAIVLRKFVNRGFLNGPVCPIYGVGVVVVLFALQDYRDSIVMLFVLSTILVSAIEWVTGWVLEKIFHKKWWDYSHLPFNLNGYISLYFSVMWGVACVAILKLIQPLFDLFIQWFPHTFGIILLCIFLAILAIDFALTVATIVKVRTHYIELNKLGKQLRVISDDIGKNLADVTLDIIDFGEQWQEEHPEEVELGETIQAEVLEKFKALKAQQAEHVEKLNAMKIKGNKRLLNAFPNIKNIRNDKKRDYSKRRK